ncbi:MAG: PAS domain S-box protein [Acidobacteria bacterium]|nr:PAS domain S-box protein [Acidobacteriota bacterium]
MKILNNSAYKSSFYRFFRSLLFIILFLIASNGLIAQKLHFRNYTIDDGLPTAQVWSIFQDSAGYMWFGTTGGLVKYDGNFFKIYTVADGLCNNIVRSINEYKGKLWITTENGVNCFDGKRFTAYTAQDGLGKGIVWSAVEHQGYIWFATSEGGLSRFDGKNFVNFTSNDGLPNNNVFSLLADGKSLWIGTRGGGLSVFDGKKFKNFGDRDGFSAKTIGKLLKDHSTIWICTRGDGLFSYQNGRFNKETRVPDQDFYCSTHNNDLWFGTLGNGVWHLNKDIANYTTANGLANNRIYSIFIDRENSIWFATDNGVSKLLSTKFLSFLENELVLSICEYKNAVWFGTSVSGLIKLENNKLTAHTDKDGLISNQIWAMTVYKNDLWLATYMGLSRFDGKTFRNYTSKDGLVTDVLFDLQTVGDTLWIASRQGIVKYDGKIFTTYTTNNGLKSNYIHKILPDGNKIWFATEEGLTCLMNGKFTNYTKDDGLSSNHVRTVYKDQKGILWLGTDMGLNRYDGKQFKAFTTKDGLTNDYVSSIIEYNGNLYLGTDKGFNVFNGEKTIKIFNKKNGLIGDESSNHNSLYSDNDHNIWFCTSRGVTKYIPKNDIPNQVVPTVYITKYFVNDSLMTPAKELVFKHNENNFGFYFAGLSFKDENDVRYQFQLDGYDNDWSNITDKREVRYTNLDDGHYTFRVRACNGDHYWSESEAKLSFTIRPPFWKTWWFGALVLCLLIYALYVSHHIRTAHLLKRAEVLERTVADRTQRLQESIIQLKTTEESLRETRDYLENLLNYANAPIIVWDPEFRITRFNHAFERLTGKKSNEIIGAKLDILFPAKRREEAMSYINRTVEGERWEAVEIPILQNNGAIRTVLWNSATLYTPDNTTIVATIAQGQDITERKLAEEEREKLIVDLKNALSKVKTLSGLLPICATCKKIRDDKGYWKQIESYIHEHSDAEFSHGICPECAAKFYKT